MQTFVIKKRHATMQSLKSSCALMKNIEAVLENIVYIELLSRGFSVKIGRVKDKEIDFIAKKEAVRLPRSNLYAKPIFHGNANFYRS